MILCNYGHGVSQKSLISKKRKQKTTKALANKCNCYTKFWQQKFRFWNILVMSIINMLFGDKVDASYGGSLL
jgi:hypothetical protein